MVTFFAFLWISTWFFIAFWIIQFMKLKENERIKAEQERISSLKGLNKLKYKIKNTLNKQKQSKIKPIKFTEKQIKKYLIASIIAFIISFIGIGITAPSVQESSLNNSNKDSDTSIIDVNSKKNELTEEEIEEQGRQEEKKKNEENKIKAISNLPAYNNSPYAVINDNNPFFNKDDLVTTSFENYSDLDNLGRCGIAIANIGKDIMPTESRGDIGNIKPTGWHTVKYNGIDGNYLYNRCHLIGFQLSGENANEKNLITGTRYLNVQGMLPFENMVADYIKETDNHVLYRVTPIFEGQNLLASGVLIEAESVEDNGKGIKFNVYCYNIQPGIEINYSNGESNGPEFTGSEQKNSDNNEDKNTSLSSNNNVITSNNSNEKNTTSSTAASSSTTTNEDISASYVLNTNTKKFHYSSCSSAKKISSKNRKEYNGSRNDLISKGYEPCKKCNP